MRSTLLVISLAGLLGSTLVALADPPAPAPTEQPAAASQTSDSDNDPNAIICKTMEPATGSRIGGRRICQTRREWDDWRKQNEETVKQFQSLGENQSANPAGGGGH
jgi:hypothetical protein